MPTTWPSPIFEKFFFRPNMTEIAVFPDFHWTFSLLSVVFSHKSISLIITMPTIKHGSIVNKTDFCSRNFLKIAGTADFGRKNGISSISWAVLFIYHEILPTDAKWQYLKCDGARLSKNIFSGRKCRKYDGKPVFWHFLEISSLVLSDFLQKDVY